MKFVRYSKKQRKASRYMMSMRRSKNGMMFMPLDWRSSSYSQYLGIRSGGAGKG